MFLAIRYLNYTLVAIAVIALSFAMVTTSDANLDEKQLRGCGRLKKEKVRK